MVPLGPKIVFLGQMKLHVLSAGFLDVGVLAPAPLASLFRLGPVDAALCRLSLDLSQVQVLLSVALAWAPAFYLYHFGSGLLHWVLVNFCF
jgi:hypothetical protein